MKENEKLKILFFGDIVGKPGRRGVIKFLEEFEEEKPDLILANGENLAAGKGMTKAKYDEMIAAGINLFTSGNHIWDNEEFLSYLGKKDIKVIRPANYNDSLPGKGFELLKIKDIKVVVANLQGRVFMPEDIEDPFVTAKNIADQFKDSIIIIDFHAEATSEKIALGYYLDGRISALFGTHTHVQTADEKILPLGTAYITDVGMCGPAESVLGVEKEIIIEKFLTQMPHFHEIAKGDTIINAIILTINKKTKRIEEIKRINKIVKL